MIDFKEREVETYIIILSLKYMYPAVTLVAFFLNIYDFFIN